MPPLIYAVLCWIAGAFVGSTVHPSSSNGFVLIVVAAAIGAVIGRIGWRPYSRYSPRVLSLTLAALSVSSLARARATMLHQRACRVALAQSVNDGEAVRIVLNTAVSARVSARGMLTGLHAWQRCRVPVQLRVKSGQASAGQWVPVRGTATVTERGVRLHGQIEPPDELIVDRMRALRARTGDVIDRDFGNNAALVRALLIADQDGISPTVRDTFATAGLVHLLSVSGLHVAIIAGALLTLAGALRLSKSVAFGVSSAVIAAYVAMLGAPAPAVRSAVMLAVFGVAERWQRPVHPWTALALGAVIPTWQPAVVLDLGYQLSVSGMAALVAARSMFRRLRQGDLWETPVRWRGIVQRVRQLRGWRYALIRETVTGIIATLVTAPLIAWTFGRLSLVAPFSNLFAGPLVAVVQPALFLALIVSPWPMLSQWVANATTVPLALLHWLANSTAGLHMAAVTIAPNALSAVCAAVAAAAFVWASGSRRWMPGLLVAFAALTVAVWSPQLQRGNGQLELHVLDVGQGDALAIRTPKGRWVLVDAGRIWEGGDAGRRTVIPYVRTLGGPVAAFMLTHAHDDHVGGAASIVNALKPVQWWEPAFVTRSAAYVNALRAVKAVGGQWHRATPSDRWTLDHVEFRVLAPDSVWTASQTDANETSVVLRVQFGEVVFLLTGDAEASEEQWLLANTDPALLRADVLKLGHHGSKTSSTAAFVAAVDPAVGVASVGNGNRYGHPSPEVLDRFAGLGVPVLRTDLEGTIVVATDGRVLEVRAGRERWRVPR